MTRTKINSAKEQMQEAKEKCDAFEENVKSMTLDQMNKVPLREEEPQTKMSANEWKKAPDIYLKPARSIDRPVDPKTGYVSKFNEKFRSQYEFSKEYVRFIAENREIIGETIISWTSPFPWMPAEMWEVPVNKPVWGPRYLAERIKKCGYHILSMSSDVKPNNVIGNDAVGTYVGALVVQSKKQRLDAVKAPVTHVSMNNLVSNF